MKNNKGFTLIEILIVIAIIAILSVVVFVALNPAGRFAEARDSRRYTDINNILTAVHQAIIDGDGALPSGLVADDTTYELGTCAAGAATCSGVTDACVDLGTPLANYLASIPVDPQDTSGGVTTGYSVTVNTNNQVTVGACNAEGGTISVTR